MPARRRRYIRRDRAARPRPRDRAAMFLSPSYTRPLSAGRKKAVEIRPRLDFDGAHAPAEDSRRPDPFQDDGIAFDAQHRAFAQADDRGVILFQKLVDSFLLRLAHMRRIGIGVLIMRADLKGDEGQRVE